MPDTGLTPARKWAALAVLCLAVLLVLMDNTIVNVALPTLGRDLNAGTSGLQWIVDSYTLVFAGLLLTGGHLGDRFGRRRMLLLGVAGFGLVSVAAAVSGSLAQLISTRAVLGLFAALVFPATLALLSNIFTDAKERAAAVGIWAATSGISVAIGPVLGGYLLEHFDWGSIFWINIPFALVTIPAVLALVPESRHVVDGKFDYLGMVLSIAGVSSLVWSVIEGPNHGWLSASSIAGFSTAVLLLALFALREVTCAHPMLDVRLFRNRNFSTGALSISLAFLALFGFIFLMTIYFQVVKGYSPLQSGVRVLPFAGVAAVMSPISIVLMRGIGARLTIAIGLVSMAIGFTMMTRLEIDTEYAWTIIISMFFVATGLAFVQGPATEVVMSNLPVEKAGAGAAVNDTTRELGGTIGVAVFGSILSGIYAGRVGDGISSFSLSDSMREAVRGSVIGGVHAAANLTAEQRGPFVHVVFQAFVDGVQRASLVSAIVTMIGAVIAVAVLRDTGAPVIDDAVPAVPQTTE